MKTNDPVPLWNWYRPLADLSPTSRVRAIYMDAPFSYTNSAGVFRVPGGQWLIEDEDGGNPRSMEDIAFWLYYTRLEDRRPEATTPEQPQPAPDEPAPDSTTLQ